MIELFNIDCMVKMAEYLDKYFDLLLADPPYGIKESAHRNISRSKLAKTRMYRKTVWDLEIPPQEWFDEAIRISKYQIIFGINYFFERKIIPYSAGRIIWDKCNDATNFSDCEIAYCSFHHSTRIFRFMWNGMLQGTPGDGTKMQSNKKMNQYRIHPTEKPIALYKWILKKYCTPEYKIIDPFGGSMSSVIAAFDFGISEMICTEKDPIHYKEAVERFNIHKMQTKLF